MPAPQLSVILVATGSYAIVRKTVEHLRAQTAAAHIELVFVAASLDVPAADMTPFACWRLVPLNPIRSIGVANAAGVAAASAPIVALAEDHCFPEPSWAANILAAHHGPWAAVGPVVKNANPASALSWADYFIGYGPWAWPSPSREADFLPGHNSSYRRDLLLAYGGQLGNMLEAETLLHWDLRAKGHRLYLDAAIVTAHTNYSRWRTWLKVQYLGGRVFGGSRLAAQSTLKRLAYAAASPLIPLVRFLRITQTVTRTNLWSQWLRSLPALAIGLTLDAAGQFTGYLAGPGHAMQSLAPYEFGRVHHVNRRDQREVFGL